MVEAVFPSPRTRFTRQTLPAHCWSMLLSGTSVITCPHTPTLAILASSMVWQSSTSVATRGDTWHHGAERGRHEYIVHLKLHHIIDGSQGLEG